MRWRFCLLLSAGLLAAPGAGRVPSAAAAPPHPSGIEGVVRDEAGTPVSDAVVYLPEAAPAPPGGSASRTAVLDQKNRNFVPQAVVVRVGTTVRFPNSEAIHHSVYSFSRAKKFEIGLFRGQGAEVAFDHPGEVKIFCNIHKRMGALVVVVTHPYAAVTDANGRFVLRDVPVGAHTVRVAHVHSVGASWRLTVGPGPTQADFRLAVVGPKRQPDPAY